MKKIMPVLAAMLLAGCAASPLGLTVNELEVDQNLRAARTLPLSFVQVQQALFKHQAACGSGPELTVDPAHPSLARIKQKLAPDAQLDRTLVMVLNLRSDDKDKYSVRTQVYSYYAVSDEQVEQLYGVVLRPLECAAAR
jgi:hypothetical protein